MGGRDNRKVLEILPNHFPSYIWMPSNAKRKRTFDWVLFFSHSVHGVFLMACKSLLIVVLLLLLVFSPTAQGGPLAYGLCQAACCAGWVTCYAAAGLVAGTVTGGVAAPPAAIACNTIVGSCMTACAAAFIAPTPWTIKERQRYMIKGSTKDEKRRIWIHFALH